MDPYRDRERQIVQQGLANGYDQEFIRAAVLRDRQRRATTQEAPTPTAQEPLVTRLAKGINKLSGGTKVAEFLNQKLYGVPTGDVAVTPKQAVGSGLQTAATIATLGVGTPETLLGRTLVSGGIGAATGAGSALQENKDAAGVAKSALISGGIGAALPAVIEGVANFGKKASLETGRKIANTAVKTPLPQKVAGKENIGEGLVKRGIVGSHEQMLTKLDAKTSENIASQAKVLKKYADKKINVQDVISELETLKDKKLSSQNKNAISTVIDDIRKEVGKKKQIDLLTAQTLKQKLQAEVGTTGFLADEITASSKEAKRLASRRIRAAIESAAPEIAPINRELEFASRAAKQLSKQANYAPSSLGTMFDLGVGAAGMAGNPQLLGIVGSRRLLANPRVSTRVAQKLIKNGSTKLNVNQVAALEKLLANVVNR